MSAAWGGAAPGLMGASTVGGGTTVGVKSISENQPSHHKYKSPKQIM